MECQQEISTSNIQNYNRVKNIFQNLINNNVHNIILVGSGSNGKSYLMKDCCDIIKDNHYSISHNSPYNLTDDEFNNFNTSNYFLISKILQKINFYFLYFYLPLRQNFLTKNFGEIDVKNQKQIFYQLHYYEEITQNQQLTLKNHTLLQKISYFFSISQRLLPAKK